MFKSKTSSFLTIIIYSLILNLNACVQNTSNTNWQDNSGDSLGHANKFIPDLNAIGTNANHQDNFAFPTTINKDQKYVFYLHGSIIENQGINAISERYGPYEYLNILNTFKDKKFEVISEARPVNTDPETYAKKLVQQIKTLIKNGVPPNKISVIGASKGSLIAMLASTQLANKDVNFVLIGNCNDWVMENYIINLQGKILSIFENSDQVGGNSCDGIKSQSKGVTSYKEIELNTNLGHGFLYRPIDEWVLPAIDWIQ